MRTLFETPKIQISIVLFLLFIVSIGQISVGNGIYLLLLCLGSTVVFDLAFTFIRRRKLFVPSAGIVTGLILTLIIDPSALWYQILAICAFSMAIKNFLRIGNRHIFNPAASGLFMGWVLFSLNPSWWGPTLYSGRLAGMFNIFIFLLIVVLAYVSCFRLKRYYTVLAYLLVFVVLTMVFSHSFSVKTFSATIITPGMLFYALLMLPEPMTSPVGKKRQILYGTLVAVIQGLLIFAPGIKTFGNSFFDSSLTALLLGNLLFFKYR